MTLQSDPVTICTPLRDYRKGNQPVHICSTCALSIVNKQNGVRVGKWITITPAFWNGERYVCDKHMEIKNGQ